jgi:hypothetical protein
MSHCGLCPFQMKLLLLKILAFWVCTALVIVCLPYCVAIICDFMTAEMCVLWDEVIKSNATKYGCCTPCTKQLSISTTAVIVIIIIIIIIIH